MKNTKFSERIKYIGGKQFVIGVDPCGSRMDCVLMDIQKNRLGKPFSFSTNHQGFNAHFFEKLAKNLMYSKDYQKLKLDKDNVPVDKIVLAIEHSINFWQNFAYFCHSKGFTVVLVNPLATFHSRPLQNADFTKTDNKDARLVGENACNGNFIQYKRPYNDVYQQAKYLSIYRFKISKDLQIEQARLRGILKFRFPEFISNLDVSTKTARYLLSNFIDAESFEHMAIEETYIDVKSISKGQIKITALENLQKEAQTSISIPFESKDIAVDGKWVAQKIITKIDALLKEISEVDKRLVNCFENVSYMENLTSLKGVSSVGAAIFLAECGDLNRYTSYKQIEKLAGLSLVLKDSGNYSGPRRVSRIGNKRLRTIIYLISSQLSRTEPGIRKKYLKRQIKKRSHTKNILSLSSNVLRLMMALAKQNRKYIEKESEVKEVNVLEFKLQQLIKKVA